MLGALVSTLLALCLLVSVDGQPSYTPWGQTPQFNTVLLTATGNSSGTLFTMYNSTRYVTAIDSVTGVTTLIDLQLQSYRATVKRLRWGYDSSNGGLLYGEDRANQVITAFRLDSNSNYYAKQIQVFGFAQFQVSKDNKYLASGGVAGAKYIDYIDVYNLATNQNTFLYRIQLMGLQVRGFAYGPTVGTFTPLYVTLGVNNTISVFDSKTGSFMMNRQLPQLPGQFAIQAIAVQGNTFALVDCDRAMVAFTSFDWLDSMVYPTTGFYATTQCYEAVTAIGGSSFAVLNGPNGLTYYAYNGTYSSTGPSSSSSTGPFGPSYSPSGFTPMLSSIRSAAGNATGTLVLLSDAPNVAYAYDVNSNQQSSAFWLDYNQPSTALPPVIKRIRSALHPNYGTVLFMEDTANSWISVYGLKLDDNQLPTGFIRSINVFGFQRFEVSSDARWLAVGGGSGTYIEFIDMYDMTQSGDGYIGRLGLGTGVQARGFTFDVETTNLHVAIGLNNTLSVFDNQRLTFQYNIQLSVPSGFTLHNALVLNRQYALIDCDQAVVAFYNNNQQPIPSSFSLSQFDPALCSESLAQIGDPAFAVLTGGTQMTYFTVEGRLPQSNSSSSWVESSSTGSPAAGNTPFNFDSSSASSTMGIASMVLSVVALVALAAAGIAVWKTRFGPQGKKLGNDSLLEFANSA